MSTRREQPPGEEVAVQNQESAPEVGEQQPSACDGRLEEMVRERTRELTEANKRLTHEIAERRRVGEERYRLLFQHSPDAILLIREGRISAANPAVKRVFGYEPGWLVGRSIDGINPKFQPDGRASAETAPWLMGRHVETGPRAFEWVFRHKGGALLDCEVSIVAYAEDDQVTLQAIVRDVTERKRAEDYKRKLEKDLENQKWQFYRDTIRSVTGGKLDVVDETQVMPYISVARLRTEVGTPMEAGDARRQAERFCADQGLQGERLETFTLGFGEAIANAVKHGVRGTVYAGTIEAGVWVGVEDKGAGINSLILPRATLGRWFSTKPSLGLGYSIMLDVSDRIRLKTDQWGTTLILMKMFQEPAASLSAKILPDTWAIDH